MDFIKLVYTLFHVKPYIFFSSFYDNYKGLGSFFQSGMVQLVPMKNHGNQPWPGGLGFTQILSIKDLI